MKNMITLFAFLLSISLSANVSSAILNDLKTELNNELYESDGQVKSLQCDNTFSGVFCYSTLQFIDTGSFESGNNGSSYSCEEIYYYLGFGQKKYETLCSNCWYNESESYYKNDCSK